MPRLFIGINLPKSYRKDLKPFTSRLSLLTDANVNWSRPETWHLTLKFLGDTEPDQIPAIIESLAAIVFPAFTMQAGSAGAFPNPRQARILWLGLEQGAEECTGLAAAVEDTLGGIGIPREKKRFRPHLTLGRVRKPGPGNWQTVLDAASQNPWPQFTVDRFILWRSQLAPTGAVHTPLTEFPLSGSINHTRYR
ncbi:MULTISPECIES: RNA 2',3'-cyclic phosphodiesterase [unclassified Pseudodesulfovibrio]|uniref:RNA 2',3'-cyclic phosphodiesterase n=1 Tax=unclassified Pseudodesulfovibrio TaxID=2661612 RepID=UPI000FEBC790|nr:MULTISPECIES: RNA 2',3'-cyclic phosphodiesterase [unclassified Pseudodesulfovibrio]MCJ2165701.1 RNA 2',3'-cyclic phosphodiesterase [Pseudodesulfovibrio sp. S3-i]RWU02962.1 RNA 2',3'-cyclic phosphodiesterase [Pseudodesulfovibrio sp. S3]